VKKIAEALKQEFVSSSVLTQQFADFYRLFKREFTKALKRNFDIQEIRMRVTVKVSGLLQIMLKVIILKF